MSPVRQELIEYTCKKSAISSKIHFFAYPDNRPANQPGLFEHQFYKIVITELITLKTCLLEAGTSKIEHIGSRFPLQQLLDLGAAEGIFKEITLVYFSLFLQEELPCLPASVSANPAIEVYLHGHIQLLSLIIRNHLSRTFSIIVNVIDLSTLTTLFSKEGLGEILWNAIKIPLNPPLQRGT